MSDHLHAADIKQLTGLSKASIARLARKQSIPGAFRHDGLHFRFPNSPALQSWIALQQAKRRIDTIKKIQIQRPNANLRLNANDRSVGLITIEGVRMQFGLWLRKVKEDDGFPDQWDARRLSMLSELIRPIAELYSEITNKPVRSCPRSNSNRS